VRFAHPCCQVARGRAIIPANKRHLELEPTIVGKYLRLRNTSGAAVQALVVVSILGAVTAHCSNQSAAVVDFCRHILSQTAVVQQHCLVVQL
jgi:thiamine biosynthesis protein ThiC